MSKLLTLLLCLLPCSLLAVVWKVGPTQIYTTPSQVASLVNAGDTVEIDAAEYAGDVCVWNKDNLLINGVNGRPHMRANGNNAIGKGIWVFAGNNITVHNIEFSEAAVPDKNGAGIRLDGIGMTATHCYFHHNEDGILTGNNGGKIVIENCEFGYNGDGIGQAHNIYIGRVDTALVRFSYFHHANVGHEFKSRASVNFLLYNRFSNEADGNASREIDLPNGGLTYIIGNVVQQGPNSDNSNMIGYGLEGLINTVPHALYVINNTLVNNRNGGSFLQADDGTGFIKIYNNILAGVATVLNFNGNTSSIDSATNFVQPDINLVGFVNAGAYEYHITASSAPVNKGTQPGIGENGFSLLPAFEYKHPADEEARTIAGIIDIGAYEALGTLPIDAIGLHTALKSDYVSITWNTSNEINIAGFELQKSVNGIDFTSIYNTSAANQAWNEYHYNDYALKNATIYYRVKIIEQTSELYFSAIVLVKATTTRYAPKANLYNNNLQLFNIPERFKGKQCYLQLYNYSGQLLLMQHLTISETNTTIPVSSVLPAQGIIATLTQGENRLTIPVNVLH